MLRWGFMSEERSSIKTIFSIIALIKPIGMNLQQLEYIIAVDTHRHFARAAEKSFVTQPTLSMMVQKLEDELGVKIFDRSKQPVTPTKEGEEIIQRARKILSEAMQLKVFTKELKEEITGTLHLGIIPTLAPYLLPLFLKSFADKFSRLKVFVREMTTMEIIGAMKKGTVDVALAATPLHEDMFAEHPLFYEEFFVYAASSEKLPKKKYLLPNDINLHHLWLLEEGHCMRDQVVNFCELKRREGANDNLHYEAGSIETLINLVDNQQGITIVPHLATLKMTARQQQHLHEFSKPKPVREVSLITLKSFPRRKLLEYFKKEILEKIPHGLQIKEKRVLPI